jgi:general secretion pathway protein E
MAEMNLGEKRLPQDGRFPAKYKSRDYDMRMSVLPTIHGENAVIRILDRGSVLLGLDNLGSTSAELACLRPWIQRSAGMIIVTGPTGSGKTTLLYSCLQEIDREQKKVLSVEDPVECEITDVSQTQVNRRIGMTFAGAMRTFLRQDPDIILCGEVRDLETAELAAEAAITGHLVLIPLHTDDAPSALTRLADIGVVRHLIVSMVNGVVATRLARRLCTHCKIPAEGDEAIAMFDRVSRLSSMGGYRVPSGAVFYTAVGCPKCRNTGYRGRLGLYEILPCNPLLISRLFQCATNGEMIDLAIQSGMRTLVADGIRKAAAGETSIDEVLRATGTWI